MTDRPTPEDDFNDLLEAAAAHRDAVTIDTFAGSPTRELVADPHADLRARFSAHHVDSAGLDSMDAIRSSCFALGRTIELHVSPGPRRGAILDGLQQIMFAANHEIARAHSLGLVERKLE